MENVTIGEAIAKAEAILPAALTGAQSVVRVVAWRASHCLR